VNEYKKKKEYDDFKHKLTRNDSNETLEEVIAPIKTPKHLKTDDNIFIDDEKETKGEKERLKKMIQEGNF